MKLTERCSATNDTVYTVFHVPLIFSFQFQIRYGRIPDIQIATEALNTTAISRQRRWPCKTNTDRAKMSVVTQKSMCTSKQIPSLSHEQRWKAQEGKKCATRNYCFFHRSFINTESCVKASASSLDDDTSLKPTVPP